MKSAFLTVAAFTCIAAQAQLTNGSFEQGLTGWEWTCSEPSLIADGAPGAGSWMVSKEAGNTQGCFPSYLFQRLLGVQDGDLVTISGWVRCHDAPPCLGANFGLGRVSNGSFTLEENVGTFGSEWVYLTHTDTVELAAGDTALLVLNSGMIGGPISPAAGFFDGFTSSIGLGVNDEDSQALVSHFDRANNILCITSGGALRSAQLYDITGRNLRLTAPTISGSSARFDLDALPTGVYFAALRTADRERVLRFVVE